MLASRSSKRLALKQIKQEKEDQETQQKETPKKRDTHREHGGKQHHKETVVYHPPTESSDDAEFVEEEDEEEDEEEEEVEIIVPEKVKRRTGLRSPRRSSKIGEVDSARLKLDDILAHMSKGDDHGDEDYYDGDDPVGSALSPPQKLRRTRGPRKSRKLLRDGGFVKTSSFVLKLFDRSVDLALFSLKNGSENLPLYPVCRAWIKNGSIGSYNDNTLNEEKPEFKIHDNESGRQQGVYLLPPPQPKPKDESGNEIELRIPKVRKIVSEIDAAQQLNSLRDDDFSLLFHNNLSHWKAIRQDWKEASLLNETRYKHSCDVLKSMYERSLTEQSDLDNVCKSASPSSDGPSI